MADFRQREALAVWLPPGRHRLSCLQRSRPDKQPPLQPAEAQGKAGLDDLDLDLVPGPVPCVRIAIANEGPRLTLQVPSQPPG